MMCRANPQYTLVGFSAGLDWRPLRFVKPIPQNRVCSACGLVRKNNALLPCMHLLCTACYDQCAQDCSFTCPLDGQQCQDDDVDWKESPADEMLHREVKCWNEEFGCEALMPASDLPKHIQSECRYHCTSCPRCSLTILCGDVWTHLRSECRDLILAGPFEDSQQPKETTTLADLMAFFQEGVAEMRADLRRVFTEAQAHSRTLGKVLRDFKALRVREANGDKLSEAAQQTPCGFTRNAAETCRPVEVDERLYAPSCTLNEISQNVNSLNQTLRQAIGAVQMEMTEGRQKTLLRFEELLAHISANTAFCHFSLTEVSALKDIVMRQGQINFTCDRVYLRGYSMSPGVRLQKDGASVSLHIRMHLHKGAIDDVLQWPFSHAIKLSVLHPCSGQESASIFKPENKDPEYFSKPAGLPNSGLYVIKHSFLLADLEREGYIEDDRLLLRYELLRWSDRLEE